MAVVRKGERFHSIDTGERDLDKLRAYLSDWQGWEKRYAVDLGAPNAVPWARYMKDGETPDDNVASGGSTINVPAMQIIDGTMAELHETKPELSIAVRWRYLNIAVDAYVFRSQRLAHLGKLSMMQLDELADAGERALLPIAKRRGLLL